MSPEFYPYSSPRDVTEVQAPKFVRKHFEQLLASLQETHLGNRIVFFLAQAHYYVPLIFIQVWDIYLK